MEAGPVLFELDVARDGRTMDTRGRRSKGNVKKAFLLATKRTAQGGGACLLILLLDRGPGKMLRWKMLACREKIRSSGTSFHEGTVVRRAGNPFVRVDGSRQGEVYLTVKEAKEHLET